MNTQKAFIQLGSLDELNPESMPMKCVYYVQQPGAKEKQPRPLPRRMRVFGWSRYVTEEFTLGSPRTNPSSGAGAAGANGYVTVSQSPLGSLQLFSAPWSILDRDDS